MEVSAQLCDPSSQAIRIHSSLSPVLTIDPLAATGCMRAKMIGSGLLVNINIIIIVITIYKIYAIELRG